MPHFAASRGTTPASVLAAYTAMLMLTLTTLGSTGVAHGQRVPAEGPGAWTYGVGADAIVAGGDGPGFWHYSNRHGTVDQRSSNALLRVFGERHIPVSADIDIRIGGELRGRLSDQNGAFIHEAYGSLRYQGFELQAGRWEDVPTGLLPPTLSIGSLGRSRNAPPMPKIALFTPSYVGVPGTNDWLAVRGYFAHGWFGSDRYVSNALLQDKSLYLRLLRPDHPVQAHAGLLMHTIWGGTHPEIGDLPDGPMTFLRVMGGRAGDVDAPEIEQDGSLGASAAGYDFGLSFDVADTDVLLSRYFHHTDRPSLFFRNPWDGIWGVQIRRPDGQLVETLLWNHLRTTRQNAKFDEGEERGEDTYYNNSLYRSGWTYEGQVLGSPLLLKNNLGPGIANNIVLAHHVGLSGELPGRVDYQLKVTYSRNYGAQRVCANPTCGQLEDRRIPRTDQYSAELVVSRTINALTFQTGIGTDTGALYADRVSVLFGFSWKASHEAIF